MKVTGEGRMKESITRKRRAASVANIGSQCDLSLKIPGNNDIIMQLSVVTGGRNQTPHYDTVGCLVRCVMLCSHYKRHSNRLATDFS